MDARLLAVIGRLSEDLANLEKALTSTQLLLRELVKDARKNGKRLSRADATKLFLANQQPRWGGTTPWRALLREGDAGTQSGTCNQKK